MKIRTIFTIKKSSLYSVAYDNDVMEFKRLFDNWISNVVYLEDFFEENKTDLQSGFYGVITIEDAIQRTRKKAILLRKKFLEIVEGENWMHEKLQSVFKPLHNQEFRIKSLSKEKSKDDWLRIYAIRISENVYVISGGAIKLTLNMNTRPHLEMELRKLEMTRQYLIKHGLTEDSDFGFFEFET